jgi:serine/threonine-protein kinase PRP4
LGHPYDAGIDIWSVGCTLYELYTGKILFPGRDNNHMLLLIMELRGKFPHRVIRKSSFRAKHFDEDLSFLFRDFDRASNHEVIRRMQNVNVTRDLKSRIMPPGKKMSEDEKKILGNFVDLLEKCLTTNPEKRIKAREALKHPFFS